MKVGKCFDPQIPFWPKQYYFKLAGIGNWEPGGFLLNEYLFCSPKQILDLEQFFSKLARIANWKSVELLLKKVFAQENILALQAYAIQGA